MYSMSSAYIHMTSVWKGLYIFENAYVIRVQDVLFSEQQLDLNMQRLTGGGGGKGGGGGASGDRL